MAKVTPVPFARGTKLSVNQLTPNLTAIRDELNTPSVSTANITQNIGTFDVHIPIASIHSRAMEYSIARLPIAVPLLPLQDEWNDDMVAGPATPRPRLRRISIAIDQRAEGYGVGDLYSGNLGKLTDTDMSRYDLTLEFVEKPLAVTQSGFDRYARKIRTVWSTTIPGVDLLGQPDGSPVLATGLTEVLDPYAGHWLIVTCPGLFTAVPGTINCALPSFNVVLTFDRILTQRDYNTNPLAVQVQNIPITNAPRPSSVVLSLPASNSLITEVHTQANLEVLDAPVNERLKGGWQAQGELTPTEQTIVDSSYSIVGIPLWAGWEDLRSSEVPARGLPYVAAPFQTPTGDRRLSVVPDGFVIHHAVLWRSMAAYPCPATGGNATVAGQVVGANQFHRIGLGLVQGWNTENTRYQQAAYLQLAGPLMINNQLDLIGQTDPTLIGVIDGQVHYVPLVYPAIDPAPITFGSTGIATGRPVYVGTGNRKTVTRYGIAPFTGGGGYVTPVTNGQETHLEARWTIEDSVDGLDNVAIPDGILLGYGGGILYLIGKMPLQDSTKQDTQEQE